MDIPHVQMSELCASKTYSACLTIQQTGPVLVSASSKNEACATAKDVLTPESVGKRIQSTKRSLFDNAVKKALDTITDYLKVAVLVLRWDEGVDEFASGHTREVNAQRSQSAIWRNARGTSLVLRSLHEMHSTFFWQDGSFICSGLTTENAAD